MGRTWAGKAWILFWLVVTAALGGLYYYEVWYLGRRTLSLSLGGRPVTFQDLRWAALGLTVPLVWLAQTVSLSDLSWVQQGLSALLRSLVLLAVTAAACRPVQQRDRSRVCAVVLADVSASVSDAQLAEERRLVRRILDLKAGNLVRLVGFARRPRLLGEDPDSLRRPKGVEAEATNLQAALQLARAVCPADTIQRFLVLSDGLQTEGNAVAEAYRAAEAGIRIHHMAFAADPFDEILIKEVKLPDKVDVDKPFNVTVEVYSNRPAKVRISLKHGSSPDDMYWNELKASQTVELQPGRNIVKFPSRIHEPGLVAYVANLTVLDGGKDRIRRNNRGAAIVTIKDKPRILIVDGGRRGHLDKFAEALRSEGFRVEIRGRSGLPATALGLKRYRCVIQSDVPVSAVSLSRMRALERYVRQFGGCYVMAGGENSFGSGGFGGSRIERLLPVRLDVERMRRMAHVALVLVIDRSGSMQGQKIELAKEAAKASAQVLAGTDLVGVVAFDTRAYPIVPLQRAANRLRITSAISSITADGGTNVYPALKMAYDWLLPARAKVKHVILLSDGQSPYGGTYDLVDQMNASGITVSTVGIGSEVDRNLLAGIARRGNGRFYHTDDPSNIPKIFVRETKEIARPSIQEGAYVAKVLKSVDFLRGSGIDKVRYFRGYNPTRAKPRAEVLVVLDPTGEPLLARWHVGTGQVVAFTSDIKGGWTADWMEQNWAGFKSFWAGLLRASMRVRSYRQFPMRLQASQGRVRVAVDAIDSKDEYLDGLRCRVSVYDWERPGRKRTFELQQVAAGRYEADFGLDRYGAYVVAGRCMRQVETATGRRAWRTVAETFGSVTLSYPREYLDMQPPRKLCATKPKACRGLVLLERLGDITHGVGLDPLSRVRRPDLPRMPLKRALFDPMGQKVVASVPLWAYFLLAAVLLFLLDVALRRIRIFGYRTVRAA